MIDPPREKRHHRTFDHAIPNRCLKFPSLDQRFCLTISWPSSLADAAIKEIEEPGESFV
jgi:hypothetical protein